MRDVNPPSPIALERYFTGCSEADEFTAVDRWLADQDDATIEQLDLRYGSTLNLGTSQAANPVRPHPDNEHPFTSMRSGYRFLRLGSLGEGGMGTVDQIHDEALARELAIKTCRPRGIDEHPDAFLTRKAAFDKEVSILARLDHPGITPIYDVGSGPGGFPAYAMKCIDGLSFAEFVLDKHPNLPTKIGIVLRCAEAIAFAHSRGIVHRDLKPENIVVGTYGEVIVVDWGLAGTIDDQEPGAAMGTPLWMAPEQAEGAAVSTGMDVWGIGALLLFCCDGLAPRDEVEINEAEDITHPLDVSARIQRGVPLGLRALTSRCLAHDPEQRPASVQRILDDLHHWLTYGVIDHDRIGWYRRLWLWARKHPRQSAFSLSAVILLVLYVSLQWFHFLRHRQETRHQVSTLIENVALDDAAALTVARQQTAAWLGDYPNDSVIGAAQERFSAALSLLNEQQRVVDERRQLEKLAMRYHQHGRWLGEVEQRLQALHHIGLPWKSGNDLVALSPTIKQHSLRHAISLNLLYAYNAARLNERFDIAMPITSSQLGSLLATLTDDDPACAAVFQLLSSARLGPHELELSDSAIGEQLAILEAYPKHFDALLSMVAPDPKLVQAAERRLDNEANAFWPNIFLGHMALRDGNTDGLRKHALIAFGRYPSCIWPTLQLAYADLIDDELASAKDWAQQARDANPANIEAILLLTAVEARRGTLAPARALVQQPVIAAHLRYHLDHPHGHPMELSALALQAAGVEIPPADAKLGPVLLPAEVTDNKR